MARKKFSAEDIINKLREAEVLTSQGKSVEEICRAFGISDQTYNRWRSRSWPHIPFLPLISWTKNRGQVRILMPIISCLEAEGGRGINWYDAKSRPTDPL